MLHPSQTRRRLDQTASRLHSLAYPAVVDAERILVSERTGRVGWDQARRLDYRSAAIGEEFGPLWASYWFQLELKAPKEWRSEEVHLLWESGCEATAWRDGVPIQGLNGGGRAPRSAVPLSESASPGERFELWVEIACNPWTGSPLPPIPGLDQAEVEGRRLGDGWVERQRGEPAHADSPARLRRAGLALFDREAWELAWDFDVLRQLEREHQHGLDPHWAGLLLSELNQFANIWSPDDRASWAAAGEILEQLLDQRGPTRNHRVIAIGHTHLDTAWLWPLAETRRKVVRSFSNQLALMDRYPEHRFASTSAQHYAWLEKDAPELFERVRVRIEEGRWAVLGGSWVEADCNLPSGESMIRQYLEGQRYFESRFGVRCREHWGPDTFGHTGALPQILRSVGIERWVTQKLSWNQYTQPSHHSFVWEGIDGSQVLAHMPPSNTCNAELTVRELRQSVADFADPDRSEVSMVMFGYGDGGGGPTAEMIERARRMGDLRGLPRVELGNSGDFFALLEADRERLASIVGELYLEFHRGTYTSQAKTKQGNRRCEGLLGEAEAAAAIAASTCGFEYPAAQLRELWQTLLLHQFHDVLPGTSIGEVHAQAERDHAFVADSSAAVRDEALAALAAPAEPQGGGSHAVNLTPFPRTELARDPSGSLVLVEARPYGFAPPGLPTDAVTVVPDEEGIVLENAALRARLGRWGELISLIERETGREVMDGPGNVLETYEDRPTSYDAWELEPYHRQTRTPEHGPVGFELISGGPLRGELRFTRELGEQTRLVQRVRLDAHGRRLEFHTSIDWRERHRVLKAAFPVAVRACTATYETAFGVHERATNLNSDHDRARYEVPGHRFADLTEHGFGVALLTNSTYGYSVLGSEMRLTLLRGPTDPDPQADFGSHEFAYAIFPHRGGWQQGGVVAEARLFNSPLCWAGAAGPGTLAFVEGGDLVLDSIKRSEDGGSLVLRLYEPHGGRGVARVVVAGQPVQATLSNSLEEPLPVPPLALADGGFSLSYGPFELITVLVESSA